MRLIHSKSLELAEFMERSLPPFAILSHTWETEEISFQEMQSKKYPEKKGYTKIRKCCEIAATAGFEYVWVDTCCIDKTSSAELTEAINSMYAWYKKADVCYVYLADYHGSTRAGRPVPAFSESRWFRRGWTLQELIAPESVIFFNSQWMDIGTKHSLREEISEITDIQPEALLGAKLEDFSVAQRMCWASRRETTRIEDEAYSLLGIFGVHMPMLYGEAGHAFIRLQEEIIKRSTDHTIFAWPHGFPTIRSNTGGLLADSPSAFVGTKSIVQDLSGDTLPFEITNKGVHLHLPIYEESFGVLHCEDLKRPGYNLAITLTRIDSTDTFRFECYHGTVFVVKEEFEDAPVIHSIYVSQGSLAKPLGTESRVQSLEYYFECDFLSSGIAFQRCYPATWSDHAKYGDMSVTRGAGLMLLPTPCGLHGIMFFRDPEDFTFDIALHTQTPAHVKSVRRNDTCRVTIRSYFNHKIVETTFEDGHDRILWQTPETKCWISIGLNRAIIAGKRAMVVTIKDEPE